jgi:hypothetical protein
MSFQADAFQNDAFQVDGSATAVVSGGYYEPKGRRRTKEDIRLERIRLGIFKAPEAVQAVEQVAQTVLQQENTALALEAKEQGELLERMLLERGIELAYPRIQAVLRAAVAEEVERQRAAEARQDEQIIRLLMDL